MLSDSKYPLRLFSELTCLANQQGHPQGPSTRRKNSMWLVTANKTINDEKCHDRNRKCQSSGNFVIIL
ncbi:hypothetical protein BS78_04G227200 [Paspalum vaginatum]|nr:hypothetical protein BS78_04G227200 [Paspalum vaginatum]